MKVGRHGGANCPPPFEDKDKTNCHTFGFPSDLKTQIFKRSVKEACTKEYFVYVDQDR